MDKEEEEGGFHSNRLVSRETQGEMSAQSQGWSREGTESPGATKGHGATQLPSCHPSLRHPPHPLQRGSPQSQEAVAAEPASPCPHIPAVSGRTDPRFWVWELPPSADPPVPFPSAWPPMEYISRPAAVCLMQ